MVEKKNIIYMIDIYNCTTKNSNFLGKAFKDKNKAIMYILGQLNEEEIKLRELERNRNLISKNEYPGFKKIYTIVEFEVI